MTPTAPHAASRRLPPSRHALHPVLLLMITLLVSHGAASGIPGTTRHLTSRKLQAGAVLSGGGGSKGTTHVRRMLMAEAGEAGEVVGESGSLTAGEGEVSALLASSSSSSSSGAAGVAGLKGEEGVKVETVEVGKHEDSGNSGVAQEMATLVHPTDTNTAGAGAGGDAEAQGAAGEGAAEGEGAAGAGAVTETAEAKAEAAAAAVAAVEPLRDLGKQAQLELEKKVHEDEEQYASFMTDVMGIRHRLAPTLTGMRDKTAKHVLPQLASLASSTRRAFAHTSKTLSSRIQPYVGSTFSPLLATILSYALLFVPLILVAYIFYTVRVHLTLRKALVLANLYLSLYCGALFFACVVLSAEPMASLRSAAESNFYSLQMVQASGYVLYLMLQGMNFLGVIQSKEKESKYALMKATTQLLAAAFVGLHYYVTVFEPAMLDHAPNTGAASYIVYAITFGVLTVLSQSDRKGDGKYR